MPQQHASSVGIYRDTELVGLANIRIKVVPLLSFGIAYLSCGPLTARDNSFSEEHFAFCIDALKREYVDKRNLLLRLVPPVRGGRWCDAEIRLLENHGFRRSKGTRASRDVYRGFVPATYRNSKKSRRQVAWASFKGPTFRNRSYSLCGIK